MSMSDIQQLALEGLATTDNLKMFQLFMKAVNMCGELEMKNQALQESILHIANLNDEEKTLFLLKWQE